MANIDIARALKDKTYFNSLTDDQKAQVRAANPAGESSLNESELDTVSGGLGGGEETLATTTTTNTACSCPAGSSSFLSDGGSTERLPGTGGCACNC